MAQQANESNELPEDYKPGVWSWDDPDHGGYTKFDDPTSKQVEARFVKAIRDRTKGPFEIILNCGPWFGKEKNKGIYTVVLTVDCTDAKRPIIHNGQQTNINSGFKRAIKRDPPYDPPLAEEKQKLFDSLGGKWEWKDEYGWKEYDLETLAQIEDHFRRREPKVHLTEGKWFGQQKNKGVYFIEFNYLSIPASAKQYNTKTNFGRWVRRVPFKPQSEESEELTEKEKEKCKADPHFLWRKFYKPLSIEDFEDQKNDNLKCSVCLEEFTVKDLIETQKSEEVKKGDLKKQIISDDGDGDANDDDEKKQNQTEKPEIKRKQHRFDLSKASDLVTDDTVVGLSKCGYGHYFYAKCIRQALAASNQCPVSRQKYGIITGNQPDGRMYITKARERCAGFDMAADSVKMMFEFPGGIQSEHHPNPGKVYFGDMRLCFLPNIKAGREAAMLLRLAYRRKLLFTIGHSLTLNQDNRITFGSIHLKTSKNGGIEKHGWPDDTYFDRLKDELKQRGITTDLFTDLEANFIQNGFSKSEVAK